MAIQVSSLVQRERWNRSSPHLWYQRRNNLFAQATQLLDSIWYHRRRPATTVVSACHGPSLRSSRALDWFVFFLADVQTGFGPFIAVYLTTQKWTQAEIGLILSVNGLVGRAHV